MKKILLCIPMAVMLGGCLGIPEVGPIPIPPSQVGKKSPLPNNLTQVNEIQIYFQDKKEVKKAVAAFEPKGLIPGEQSPMIPLSDEISDLQALGFKTNISQDGEEALLTYNDSTIKFKVGDKVLYKNNDAGVEMWDAPIYNNSTIYIPIIPVLDVLHISYEINGSTLEIGRANTEES